MRVVELVQCRINFSSIPSLFDPPTDPSVATIRNWLTHISRVLHKASDFQPRILQDEQDLGSVYFITVWHDIAKHDAFITSPARAELIKEINVGGSLDWIGLFEVKHPNDLPLKANVLAFARFHIATSEAEEFEKEHQKVKHVLRDYAGHSVCEGWKVQDFEMNDAGELVKKAADQTEAADGRREYIVFSGYDTVEQRKNFPTELDKWQEYATIKRFTKWFERKNVRIIELQ